MIFDWPAYLESVGVEYVSGPAKNVARGHVGINCPFCQNDTGHHFGIRLEDGRVRGCWKDRAHWASPERLVAILTGCSFDEAAGIYNDNSTRPDVSIAELRKRLETGKEGKPLQERPMPIEKPTGFKLFKDKHSRVEQPYRRYLKQRGFSSPELLSNVYGVGFCPTGEWSHRILIPFWDKHNFDVLVGWTGRSIIESEDRYKTHPHGNSLKDYVYNLPIYASGEILVIVEGPLDVLKLDSVIAESGMRSWVAGVLGSAPSSGRINEIAEASQRFKGVVVLFDKGARSQSMQLASDLATVGAKSVELPTDWEDPGEMSERAAEEFLMKLQNDSRFYHVPKRSFDI